MYQNAPGQAILALGRHFALTAPGRVAMVKPVPTLQSDLGASLCVLASKPWS